MAKYTQGKFHPRNPDKYMGDVNNIIFRSSWEESFNRFLDNNSSILEWGSEIIAIPYIKPTTGKQHKYYPDYLVRYQDKNNVIITELIEVKPAKECVQPTTKGRKSEKTKRYEQLMWAINVAKWKSATAWCKQRNIQFRIVTENSLFRK